MRGRRVGSPERFQRAWNSFQAIWKAMAVFPVPGGQRQQDAGLASAYGFQRRIDGIVLVITEFPLAARRLERHRTETVAPLALNSEAALPQIIRRRERLEVTFFPRMHVGLVPAKPIGGIGEARLEPAGIVRGLPQPGRMAQPRPLGLDC